MSRLAAHWLIVSNPKIRVPLEAAEGTRPNVQTAVDFEYSAFLEPQDGAIVPVRQSISAILLISLWKSQCEIVGMLHPQPGIALDYHLLPEVPFLRIQWPIAASVQTEWIIAHPAPHTASYAPVTLTDDELKKN